MRAEAGVVAQRNTVAVVFGDVVFAQVFQADLVFLFRITMQVAKIGNQLGAAVLQVTRCDRCIVVRRQVQIERCAYFEPRVIG